MQTVFYSWQSDLPNATNRSFIESCLAKAIKELRAEGAIHIDPSPDRDTQGVPGSPDIAETIFEKIDACAAFVGDVSFINGCHPTPPKVGCDCTRPTPNPNVLCEWGRATKSIGFERVLVVFNEATGKIEDLPFDLRKRRVIPYSLKEGDDKSAQQKALVGKLKGALQSVLDLPRTALTLEFADRSEERALGEEMTIRGTFLDPIPTEDIPDFGIGGNQTADLMGALRDEAPNRDYFREKAVYLAIKTITRPIGFVAQNAGDRLLRNVRLEIAIPVGGDFGIGCLEEHELPALPKRMNSLFPDPSAFAQHRRAKSPGDLTIKRFPDRCKIVIEFGDIQPKASIFSEPLYIGSAISQRLNLLCVIYADELASPEQTNLTLIFETGHREMTMDDLHDSLPAEIEKG